ncbi:glycosyltransferase family 4 protein [Jannaschia sp. W003]|uniref:glycosyltransferase family 4 protein n=1 Tax=Jannaschia sp. W003 TaxID=2867012 RepID=UPI0021A60262|nr:glycosyltransferase family 4 protein [Jannaschia sp. W003]UWQ23181.1 glycosyltransferase family 4 protein [Jannaschia sp. W003]
MTDTPAPRVAYLTGEYPVVSHTFILREVEALRRAGLEVQTCAIRRTGLQHHRGPAEKAAASSTFYVLSAARQPGALLAALGWTLARPVRFGRATTLAWRTAPPGGRAKLWQLFYLMEAMVLARYLARARVDHLHNHFANSSCSVAMLASELGGVPFSFTLHGPSIFFEPRWWRIDVKIARARFVACISHFCRSQGMIFADPAHWSKMRIVHCGVDPDRYDRTEGEVGGPGKHILFVGRLAAVKGVRVLLEAFARVRAAHPDARLTLVGDGDERAAIEDHARALGCDDGVRFTGYLNQDEVAEALAQADLFALPSFAEGVPVVLMEAMAARLPVLATRIAGIPELVEDGVAGRLVPPGDVDAFADALDALLNDPAGRTAMGAAGRARVEAEFHVEREARNLARLIAGDGTT